MSKPQVEFMMLQSPHSVLKLYGFRKVLLMTVGKSIHKKW